MRHSSSTCVRRRVPLFAAALALCGLAGCPSPMMPDGSTDAPAPPPDAPRDVPTTDAGRDATPDAPPPDTMDASPDAPPPPPDAADVTPPPDNVRVDVAPDAPTPDVPSLDAATDATTDAAADVTRSDASTDGPPFDISFPDVVVAPDGATVCNSVALGAAFIPLTMGTGSPPAQTGGTVVPGHYELTSLVGYGPGIPPGLMLREAIDIGSGVLLVAADTMSAIQRTSFSYSAMGTTFTTTPVCPMPGTPSSGEYTATPTTFTISQGGGGSTVVGTFTLR